MTINFSKAGALGCLTGFGISYLVRLIFLGEDIIHFLFYWDIALSLTIALASIMGDRKLKW